MEDNLILAYLDHNILDLMTKGDPHNVKEILNSHNLTPVYSDESLKEVQRSIGYEIRFIELLEEIGAKHIEPLLDQSFKQTGQARINSISPKICYEHFLCNQNETTSDDFGLSEILMKFYGGQPDKSFEEIFQEGSVNLQNSIKEALSSIEDLPLDKPVDMDALNLVIEELPKVMKTQSLQMVEDLDKQSESPILAFEKYIGLGPVVFKNVTPPNVVGNIWKMISATNNFTEIDMETFFGVKPQIFEADSGRKRTLQENVNAVYHQLNFLGYYRDSKMKKERRFKASFSDMTHAGIASFCHFFLCRDEDLVMKAAAAYEYLGVQTKILHYKSNKTIQPPANASAD
jgi:hypothetical protein